MFWQLSCSFQFDKGAQYGVDAAKEQLANLQLAEKAAQQKAQRLAKVAGVSV